MQTLTHSLILKSLGWLLFNSLWQMGLCWLTYNLLISLFRRRTASFRHGIALLMLLTGALWSAISMISYLQQDERSFSTLKFAAPIDSQAILVQGWRMTNQFLDSILPLIAAAYTLFLAIQLTRYAGRFRQIRRLRTTGLSELPAEMRLFTAEMAGSMGIRETVGIWHSDLIDVPVTLGFLKPLILLPVAMSANLTIEQTEAIILHELAHIRRKDYLTNFFVSGLELLFFYNPFARQLIQKIKTERENCCDDTVLQFRYDPRIYILALLSLAGGTPNSGGMQLALAANGSNEQYLLHRVRRILQLDSLGDSQTSRPFLLFLFSLVIAGLFFLERPFTTILDRNSPNSPYNSTLLHGNVGPIFPFDPTHPNAATSLSDAATPTPSAPPIPSASASAVALPFSTVNDLNLWHPAPPKARIASNKIVIVVGKSTDNQHNKNIVYTDFMIKEVITPNKTTAVADLHPREYTLPLYRENKELKINKIQATPEISAAPYVPEASFQYRMDDSSQSEEQSAMLQMFSGKITEESFIRVHTFLKTQLKAIAKLEEKEPNAMLAGRRLEIQKDLKLQEQYINRQRQLQKKLQQTIKQKVIVVI